MMAMQDFSEKKDNVEPVKAKKKIVDQQQLKNIGDLAETMFEQFADVEAVTVKIERSGNITSGLEKKGRKRSKPGKK